MRTARLEPDREYLTKRVHEETEAAIRSGHPRAAAAHVGLAIRYLHQLNGAPPETRP